MHSSGGHVPPLSQLAQLYRRLKNLWTFINIRQADQIPYTHSRRPIRRQPSAARMSVCCPIATAVARIYPVSIRVLIIDILDPSGSAMQISFGLSTNAAVRQLKTKLNASQHIGGLNVSVTPQIVLLTFDDAINTINIDLYNELLNNETRKNPNGCPWRATFYISHEWTDYGMVQDMYSDGHEMASHTVS